ncbi:carbon-nitrogen family hydrolase [Staphylococcus arlettae]|uniref:carbon-nitrogen family hydrolase n=1 Tax=Staphylococcus arlettae TaxID=29378 RepID=UPI001E2D24D1|nr:carbon-nitrogen family hydrolase [Staphylococcus arlettae]MCD8888097.1 carbon-nitrogen family hydrolase [Staphylococcus arlettae]
MKVQIFQFEIKEVDFENNKNKIAQLFENNYTDADVVVIPEMWNNGYALNQLVNKADINLENSYPFIQKLAQSYNTNIIAGSVSNYKNDGIYNTAFSVANDGTLINTTDKIHLVPMLDEHKFLESGNNEPNTFEINGVLATQVICYDLRYPEITRTSIKAGAQIVFVVAQWTIKNLHHWRTLLQARAIENNCYIVACNSVGKVNHENHKTNTYAGHSMVVNPNGEILIEAQAEEAILEAEIDISAIEAQRKAIPTLNDI